MGGTGGWGRGTDNSIDHQCNRVKLKIAILQSNDFNASSIENKFSRLIIATALHRQTELQSAFDQPSLKWPSRDEYVKNDARH